VSASPQPSRVATRLFDDPGSVTVLQARAESSGARARHFDALFVGIEILADLLAVMLAINVSYSLYQTLELGKHALYPRVEIILLSFVFGTGFVLLMDRYGAYRPGSSLLRVRETERILFVSALTFFCAFSVTFFTNRFFSRWVVGIGFLSVPLLVALEKQFSYWLIRALHSRGYGVQKVVIYGAGYSGRRIFSALCRSPKLGLDPVAFVDDNRQMAGAEFYESGYQRRRSAPVLAGPLTTDLIRRYGAGMVIIGVPSVPRERFIEIAADAATAGATVSFVPQHSVPSEYVIHYSDIDGLLLASFAAPPKVSFYNATKRLFDFAGAIFLLILTSPLFLVITLVIRCTSPGPAFFTQERVGKDGKVFKLWKFRTMFTDAPAYAYSPKASEDPRITRIGRFLRRTSLDELPQLVNVFNGEMSLVGPRPEMPFIVENYSRLHKQRLQVLPGITGLWQLSGDRAYLIHENIEYDLYYIRNRNFFMDLAILIHTIFFAARGI
jgi:exopolysaccharide biosynthesis polyprenyl glycosylphosphotransferase